jgi:hypothetical protein
MKKERYFFYMARKWGDKWYNFVEEELGWSGQWVCGMLFGKYYFDKSKKKLP